MDTSGGFFVDTIVAKGLPEGPGVPNEVSKSKCRCDSCAHTILHDDCVSTVGCCHWSSLRRRVAAQDELFAGLKCQPGFVCSRPELSEDLRTLLACVPALMFPLSCVLMFLIIYWKLVKPQRCC